MRQLQAVQDWLSSDAPTAREILEFLVAVVRRADAMLRPPMQRIGRTLAPVFASLRYLRAALRMALGTARVWLAVGLERLKPLLLKAFGAAPAAEPLPTIFDLPSEPRIAPEDGWQQVRRVIDDAASASARAATLQATVSRQIDAADYALDDLVEYLRPVMSVSRGGALISLDIERGRETKPTKPSSLAARRGSRRAA